MFKSCLGKDSKSEKAPKSFCTSSIVSFSGIGGNEPQCDFHDSVIEDGVEMASTAQANIMTSIAAPCETLTSGHDLLPP